VISTYSRNISGIPMTFIFTAQNFPELRSPKVPENSKAPPPLKNNVKET
jgi:hypothetical protein